MPVVTVARAGTVGVSGLAAGAHLRPSVSLADPVQVYGLPAAVRTPDPTPTTTPDAVRARVLNSAGTFIANLPHAEGLRWLDEFNTAGAGSIDVRRYDDLETAHPTLWAAGNQVMVAVGSRDVFRLVLDAEPGYRIDPDTGARIDSRAGAGALGVLNSGMCWPEYGWRAEGTDERSFDYGSNPTVGGWYVAGEWKTPAGKLVRKSWRWTYKKRHQPKGWREKKSQWLWWKNPDSTSTANETCYFVSDPVVLSSARRVKIWVAGDDTLELQVDGEIRATTGPGGWKKATKIVLTLSAGTHYISAKVTNTAGSSGNQNRSGFIFAMARIDGNGDVVSWLLRSSPSTFKVRRQGSAAPGWFAGQILRQLVSEQKTRGCAGHSPITFGFTTATDSAKVAWAGRQEMAVTVGTLGLDYVQQLVEAGIDVAMTPGLVLNAWRSRGVDRSGWVRLDQGDALALDESGSQPPAIRNVAYGRAKTGWVGRSDSASVAANGERETLVSLGSSRSAAQTSAILGSMLGDLADPPQTIEVKLSGATGKWQPYRDFNVGDWVGYRAAGWTSWRKVKVMSIGGEVNDAGHPDWTLQLYEG
jgi:hypothetical protein